MSGETIITNERVLTIETCGLNEQEQALLREAQEYIARAMKDGGIAPHAVFLARNTPDGKPLESPITIALPFPENANFGNPHHRQMFADLIRFTALLTNALAVMFLSESWTLDARRAFPTLTGKAFEEASLKMVEEWGGRVREHPAHQEHAIVWFESLSGSTVCATAEVIHEQGATDDSDGPKAIGPWTIARQGATPIQGIFTDLMPHAAFAPGGKIEAEA